MRLLAAIALNNLNSFVEPNLQKIKENKILFEKMHLRNQHLFDFHAPNAGSTAFIKLKINDTALNFAEKLVADTGIMLLPSEMFDYGTSHAGIGFGRQNMPVVLEIFEDYLQKST